jgi:hypothetical protein
MHTHGAVTAVVVAVLALSCGGGNTPPQDGRGAPGAERTAKTATLETGAALVQAKAPVEQIAIYLDGFHVAKADPRMQMEAHHYCNQVNEDLAQCVLFDGNTAQARMTGVEYIISEKLYGTLPAGEKAYWHPHNYEILSGQLRMPGLPEVAERETLEGKINSYGKTWHTWMSGMPDHPADPLPFGPAQLQWSFNRDGEASQAMVAARDTRMGFDSAATRNARAGLVPLARPQGGVAALADHFPKATPVAGVTDSGDGSTGAVPIVTLQPRPAGSR